MNLAYFSPSIPVNLFSLGHLQRCGASYGPDPLRPLTHVTIRSAISGPLLAHAEFPPITSYQLTSPTSSSHQLLAPSTIKAPWLSPPHSPYPTAMLSNECAPKPLNNYTSICVTHPTAACATTSLVANCLSAPYFVPMLLLTASFAALAIIAPPASTTIPPTLHPPAHPLLQSNRLFQLILKYSLSHHQANTLTKSSS